MTWRREAEYQRAAGGDQKSFARREQTIVELRFGLNTRDGEEKTQKEVADLLGISQSYISRLEKPDYKKTGAA